MIFKTLGVALGGMAAAALAAYTAGGVYFQSHFYPGTLVNGIDASGANVDAVETEISNIASNYCLTLEEAGGKVEQILPQDVGLVVDARDGQVEGFMKSQNGWGWINALAAPMEFESKGIVTYSKSKLKDAVSRLDCVNAKNVVKTEDAYPEFNGSKFVAVPEVYGTEINKKQFTKKVGDALTHLKESVSLEEEGFYNQPNIKADSEEMQQLLSEMNRIASTKLTYTVGETTEEVPKETIASWLVSPDSKTLTYDNDAMMAFLDQMAAKYDTFGLPKVLKTSSGAYASVPGGSYGWRIDKEAELANLQKELVEGNPIQRDFTYQYTAHTHDGPDYGNSYVEVNLSAQHVYMYTNGQLICDGPCVSGDVSKGNITHRGAYQMTYKEYHAVLRGQGYDVPVDYWMPFNGNEGLHDAQWRRGFGGSIYMTNGSHGCVNLPLSTAAGIFGQVEKGFPVLVYSNSDLISEDQAMTMLGAARHTAQSEETDTQSQDTASSESTETDATESGSSESDSTDTQSEAASGATATQPAGTQTPTAVPTAETQTTGVQTTAAQTTEPQATAVQTTEAQTTAAQTVEVPTTEAQIAEVQAAEAPAAEVQAVEAQATETQIAEAQAAEAQTAAQITETPSVSTMSAAEAAEALVPGEQLAAQENALQGQGQ